MTVNYRKTPFPWFGGKSKAAPLVWQLLGDPHQVFLDPPYSAEADRHDTLYASEDLDIAHAVRDWCLEWGQRPNVRIVLAGYEGEGHEPLEQAGWTAHEWYSAGFLTGGYGAGSDNGHQQHRERLWASPACVIPDQQLGLFQQAGSGVLA